LASGRSELDGLRFGAGFYAEERGDEVPFRWMSPRAEISLEAAPVERFLELWVRSPFHDLSQRLALTAPAAQAWPLARGWNGVSIRVPAGATALTLEASPPFPREHYPGDERLLAVEVRSPRLHADARRHEHVARQQRNAVANLTEMLHGATELASGPVKLGIDVEGACNVKPPCVYCAWDYSKGLEGDNTEAPFTLETLAEWGAFFDDAAELVNCSIGEPFMGKNIEEVLDAFGERGKMLEITINGQILTDGHIAKLLGRNMHLYISFDAATAATYARLRNGRFDQLVANVRRLIAAKGGPGKLPLVYLVFMPMPANLQEVDAFVRLAADLKPDRMVLRPLNDGSALDLKWDRAGYRFDYQKEILPFEEKVRISGRVAELCARLGVPLADQMDFGGSMEASFHDAFARGRHEALQALGISKPPAAEATTASPAPMERPPVAAPAPLPSLGRERLPACTEPWTSLYILRRGVLPCCFGGKSIAPTPGYREAWNAPLMQDIRRDLAAGRFHRYCLDSEDCPIVRKSSEARRLSWRESFVVRGRQALVRLERAGIPWPRRAWRGLKALLRGKDASAAIAPNSGRERP